MAVQADRPQYADGSPVPDTIDGSTREWSRGYNPALGAKTGAEPSEPVPTITSKSPSGNLDAAGGQTVTITGDNLGGSTGATVGGTAVTSFTVVSETQATFVMPAKTAGTYNLVVANPAGNSANFSVTTA